MTLRKRDFTNEEIDKLKRIEDDPIFCVELMALVDKTQKQEDEVLSFLAERVLENPLHWSLSVTMLVYEVCNAFNDWEINRDWLSELVVEIEDFVEEIEKIVEKYKKYK